MNIGILQCDDVLEQYQTEFGNYPDMLIKLFSSVRDDLTFQVYDVRELQYPMDLKDHHAYITTGSRHGVNDDLPWIPPLLQFIQQLHQHKHPLIGICFGHQAIAKALGGKVESSSKGWGVGLSRNEQVKHKKWMQPAKNPLNIVVSHKDQVTELPNNTTVLYESDFCPNYMLQVEEHFVSIQGHPEFCQDYARTLMMHRKNIIPASVLDQGVQSLLNPSDDRTLAQWLLQFIDNHSGDL